MKAANILAYLPIVGFLPTRDNVCACRTVKLKGKRKYRAGSSVHTPRVCYREVHRG